MVVKSATLSGGATGTVNGTVISMSTAATTWSGGSGFTITNSTTSAKPTGVRFTGNFWPVGNSYAEVAPVRMRPVVIGWSGEWGSEGAKRRSVMKLLRTKEVGRRAGGACGAAGRGGAGSR